MSIWKLLEEVKEESTKKTMSNQQLLSERPAAVDWTLFSYLVYLS
ncbi:hypothetical protein [Desulfosporosinus sp. Sb-LF]|nr:hypothetical protein [Desulfosporosinus sp. Sb-LF]